MKLLHGCGLLILLASTTARAHTSGPVQQTCPIDGTEFTATMDMSGTSFGMRLDLKKIGPIASPWSLAVCPKDHFVLFKQEFPEEELAQLRKFIPSPDYQKWTADNPSYFLLGKILEFQKKGAYEIAHAFLQASWQVEDNPAPFARSAGESLRYFKQALSEKDFSGDRRVNAELLAGELERRTGDFAAARARFERIANSAPYNEGFLKEIVAYQLTLIAASDSKPHEVPSDKKADGKAGPAKK